MFQAFISTLVTDQYASFPSWAITSSFFHPGLREIFRQPEKYCVFGCLFLTYPPFERNPSWAYCPPGMVKLPLLQRPSFFTSRLP